MVRLIHSLISGGYRPVGSALPAERRVSCPAGFSFGVPWPWEQIDPATLLDQGGAPLADPPDLAVAAPRADGRSALFVVGTGGPCGGVEHLDTASELQQLASATGGRSMGIRKVMLGGVRCQILRVETRGELLQWIFVCRHQLVQGHLRVPAPGYLHHFETMLATWSWHR